MPKVNLGKNLRKETRLDIMNQIIRHRMIDEKIETQDQLASYLGLDRSSINKRISGETKWKYDELCNLFSLLHFSPEEIAKAMGAKL